MLVLYLVVYVHAGTANASLKGEASPHLTIRGMNKRMTHGLLFKEYGLQKCHNGTN
jgi:hypothetical protein